MNPSEKNGLQGAILRAAKATNEQLKTDMAVVRRILTGSYTVRESKHPNAIHCTSRIGINDATDAPFEAVMAAFRQHFGARLLEVDENVCYWHTDFTIYLRQNPESATLEKKETL